MANRGEEEEEGSEGKEGNDLCCCLYSCYCYYCGCWASGWLKFLGWSQVILYSTIALLSVTSILLNSVTKEPVGRTGFHFDFVEVMLIVTFWAPAPLLTLPFHLVQMIGHCLDQLFAFSRTGWMFVEAGRHVMGQQLVQTILTLVFLLVGIYMAVSLLVGIQKRNVQKIKIWTIYVGVLMGLTVIEAIIMLITAVILQDPLLTIRPFLSFLVHGFTLGAGLLLLAELQKDTTASIYGGPGVSHEFEGIQ